MNWNIFQTATSKAKKEIKCQQYFDLFMYCIEKEKPNCKEWEKLIIQDCNPYFTPLHI